MIKKLLLVFFSVMILLGVNFNEILAEDIQDMNVKIDAHCHRNGTTSIKTIVYGEEI